MDELATEFYIENLYREVSIRGTFIKGFNSAEPHIRQDERERVLEIVRKGCGVASAAYVEQELKRLDNVNGINIPDLNIKKTGVF